MTHTPCTLSSLYAQIKKRLLPLGLSQAELEAECRLVLEDITAIHTSLRLIAPETPISTEHQVKINDIVEKRLQERVPLQYLLGQADFYGLKLAVTADVLIPRPETELLVGYALEHAQTLLETGTSNTPLKILDLGTGSGAIAIALAQKLAHQAIVTATDISPKALAIAQKNAHRYGVSIAFREGDWFSALPKGECFDLIVSNPPYIGEAEKRDMQPEVLVHEPHQALFAPDNDRERFYRKTAQQGKEWLGANGAIFLELGFGLESSVRDLFAKEDFSRIEVYPDFSGISRVFFAAR
ncbi:MAG: peptide chain release factor N(5)-glutamine methyltransferase [Vampirovibrionales bacterium]|nr:peptide chain release factor N(5)-glutamine methyltransferase [Vampirovibrionales bacterium]